MRYYASSRILVIPLSFVFQLIGGDVSLSCHHGVHTSISRRVTFSPILKHDKQTQTVRQPHMQSVRGHRSPPDSRHYSY